MIGPFWATANRIPGGRTASNSRAIPNAAVDAAFVAALEKVNKMFGPAIFVGWSTAGGLGQRLVVARPELIRALVILEGYNGQMPLPHSQGVPHRAVERFRHETVIELPCSISHPSRRRVTR